MNFKKIKQARKIVGQEIKKGKAMGLIAGAELTQNMSKHCMKEIEGQRVALLEKIDHGKLDLEAYRLAKKILKFCKENRKPKTDYLGGNMGVWIELSAPRGLASRILRGSVVQADRDFLKKEFPAWLEKLQGKFDKAVASMQKKALSVS